MPNPHFIGLVHSILSSAQAALGEENSPMTRYLIQDGIRAKRTAEKSLELLSMLHEKTAGNLDDTEREALLGAQKTVMDALNSLDAKLN